MILLLKTKSSRKKKPYKHTKKNRFNHVYKYRPKTTYKIKQIQRVYTLKQYRTKERHLKHIKNKNSIDYHILPNGQRKRYIKQHMPITGSSKQPLAKNHQMHQMQTGHKQLQKKNTPIINLQKQSKTKHSKYFRRSKKSSKRLEKDLQKFWKI